jgi:hypothetical protein
MNLLKLQAAVGHENVSDQKHKLFVGAITRRGPADPGPGAGGVR